MESYGTGTQVRLPGKSAMEPRIFKFGTPYSEMYRSLSATSEDEAYFLHNGVLQLCKRGSSVKVRTYMIHSFCCSPHFGDRDIVASLRPLVIAIVISPHALGGRSLPPSDGKTRRRKMYRSTTS